jgi:hypothetical protein
MQLDQVNNEVLRGGASHVIEHACWITRTHTCAAVLTVIASSISTRLGSQRQGYASNQVVQESEGQNKGGQNFASFVWEGRLPHGI